MENARRASCSLHEARGPSHACEHCWTISTGFCLSFIRNSPRQDESVTRRRARLSSPRWFISSSSSPMMWCISRSQGPSAPEFKGGGASCGYGFIFSGHRGDSCKEYRSARGSQSFSELTAKRRKDRLDCDGGAATRPSNADHLSLLNSQE